LKVFARRYRSQVLALTVASIIGLFALVVEMTFTAEATPGIPDSINTDKEKNGPTVDLDSLYAAKAAEETISDSALSLPIEPETSFSGHVSWYGPGFNGRKTANGERFNMNEMTAAHKRLPFNSIVRVVDQRSGYAVLVRINDRGPYIRGRVIDLSREAATRLGMRGRGTTSGKMEIFPAQSVDIGVKSVSDGADSPVTTFLTFDAEARGARPNGWSVQVGSFATFDQSVNLYDKLRESFDRVFLSYVEVDGNDVWTVSVGLYGTRYLGEDLLVELVDRFAGAELITFENGLPVRLEGPESGRVAEL
jgi:rare lipoprotein A